MEVLTKTLHTIMPFAQLGLTMLLIIWATGLALLLKRQARQQGAVAANLQKELAVQAETVATLNNSLVEMQQQMHLVSERQDQLELREVISRTYEPAIKLAHKGADIEELVSSCGLARGEAELIMMMYREKKQGGK